MIYKAHIREETGEIQTVKEHSENTASMCREFAVPVLRDVAYVAGLVHDIGKMQESFQRKLTGAAIHVEHSGCGAVVVKRRYPDPIGLMLAYCIAGHHSGIPDGGFPGDSPDMSTLNGRLKRRFEDFSAYKEEFDDSEFPRISQKEICELLTRDCDGKSEILVDKFAFFTRYLFSCLVDADSLDTARFCTGETVRPLRADFEACLRRVNEKLSSFICTTPLQEARKRLQQQVFEKAAVDGEIYLMNMPTGSGKTLGSIKLALERAILRGKKRIIYVIPYNSIIDQTVSVFETIFGADAEILRHQSTFSYEDTEDMTEDYRRSAEYAVENWDTFSILVTTAVQFFGSLYTNKRKKLRKIHNMADSVLIFDEAHLMPREYLQPCLRAIAYITKYLNSEAVFLTATMPDFPKLLQEYALKNSRIVDLVVDTSDIMLFRKCRYRSLGNITAEKLIEKAADGPSTLMIVNSKKSARKLYRQCTGKKYYLSTYLTARDRERRIREIGRELAQQEKDFPDGAWIPEDRRIMVVSTSLVEAGVDLDFYTVYRELSGLDNILQAGGRCNREGKRDCAEVFIFELEEEQRPRQSIEANITAGILERFDDIACSESIREYYDRLYREKKSVIEEKTITRDCCGIRDIPFAEYAKKFKLIEADNTVALVVPQDETSREIVTSLRYTGGSGHITRKLQKYACSISRRELDELICQHAADDFDTGIWCLVNPDYYDEELGILFEAKDYIL